MSNEPGKYLEWEQPYLHWLSNVKGIGAKTALRLMEAAGDGKEVYHLSDAALSGMLTKRQKEAFSYARKSKDVHNDYEKLKRRQIRFLSCLHPEYPGRLKEIPDPPFGIYVKGRLPEEHQCSVAMIGARVCTEYGRRMAVFFARQLAQAGIQVISGMARGIDGISQKGALQAGGSSFAVLGSGVDVCYPESNKELYEQLIRQGGIISEYPPGTKPAPGQFPPRNRIISGLSDGVLVIEAKEKSGTLITVDMALEQGREVYVLPGRLTDGLSTGCNRLIKQGAAIVLSPEELIEEIKGITAMEHAAESGKYTGSEEEAANRPDGLSDFEWAVYEQLDYYPRGVQQLYEKIPGSDVAEVVHALCRLCLRGVVRQVSGGQYVKV